MTIFCNSQIIDRMLQMPNLYEELEVPRIGPHTLHANGNLPFVLTLILQKPPSSMNSSQSLPIIDVRLHPLHIRLASLHINITYNFNHFCSLPHSTTQ